MPTPTIGQQAIDLFRKYATKAAVARILLERGYSVSEISKAVPMAYSQVHSIHKEMQSAAGLKPEPRRPVSTPAARPAAPWPVGRGAAPAGRASADSSRSGRVQNTGAARAGGPTPQSRPARSPQPAPSRVQPPLQRSSHIGKLRTPGQQRSDVDAGPCANCGHDLVVRDGQLGLMLVHVNMTADEYLDKVQFCQGIPKSLV